jgi:hypothetical protein
MEIHEMPELAAATLQSMPGCALVRAQWQEAGQVGRSTACSLAAG